MGSLAESHRLLHPTLDDEFATLFLKEQSIFSYLYPAQFNMRSFQRANLPVKPLPKTALSCKRFPGFRPVEDEEYDDERHGVCDGLLNWTVFSLLSKEQASLSALLSAFANHETCSFIRSGEKRCGQPLEHIQGYYRRDRSHAARRMKASVNTRLQTRTGINREWGTVEERILYNREVFDEGTCFWGEIILHDEPGDILKAFIEEADAEGVIRMGTARTRGLGRVEVKLVDAPHEDPGAFQQRLLAFDAAVRTQAQSAGVRNLAPFYLALTLHSPAILRDSFLRYQKTLNLATLPEIAKLSGYTFHQVFQATSIQRITGWNTLWGTPRASRYALEAGSTFLFSCNQQPGEELLKVLHQWEETGIGSDCAEGFGRVSISDPFHLEREQA
jgi:CRISPR-associated Csx10 family RAMP protein